MLLFSDIDSCFESDYMFYRDNVIKTLKKASNTQLINDYIFFKLIYENVFDSLKYVGDTEGTLYLDEFQIMFDKYLTFLYHEMAMRFYKNYLITHQEDNKNEE